MKKCFQIFHPKARLRKSRGKYEPLARQFYATDEADALKQFAEQVQTGPQCSSVKEWKPPFDSECLTISIANTQGPHNRARLAVAYLRQLVDAAARELTKQNANWHDDPQASDHPCYHAPAEDQFPREMRDEAILELVRYHLESINSNEAAEKKRHAQQ